MNKGSVINYNLNEELMKADGYKPFIKAETENGKAYTFRYEETETAVKEIAEEVKRDFAAEFYSAKQAKKQKAADKAYEYINSGALYEYRETAQDEDGENVINTYHIEANDGNISKLGLAAVELLLNNDTESTIDWCTAEDKIVQLNAVQLQKIVKGLKYVQTDVWTNQYSNFMTMIEKAENIEELNSIDIIYVSPKTQDEAEELISEELISEDEIPF